MKSRAVNLW